MRAHPSSETSAVRKAFRSICAAKTTILVISPVERSESMKERRSANAHRAVSPAARTSSSETRNE